jgi:hypothetical protein
MDLGPNEEKQGNWTLNLLLDNSRYNGKLVITNQNVYYDINYNVGGAAGVSNQDGEIKFSKNDIAQIETFTQYWIFQRFKITLKNSQQYVFDRGIMPISGIVKLLQ